MHHMGVGGAGLAKPNGLVQNLCTCSAGGNATAQEPPQGLRPGVRLQGIGVQFERAPSLQGDVGVFTLLQ